MICSLKLRYLFGHFSILLLGFCSSSAWAALPSPYIYITASAQGYGGNLSTTGTQSAYEYNNLPYYGVFSEAKASVTASSVGPSLSTSIAVATNNYYTDAIAGGVYRYYFEVEGPTPTVNVNWQASVSLTSDPIATLSDTSAQLNFMISAADGSGSPLDAGLTWYNGGYTEYGFTPSNLTGSSLAVSFSASNIITLNTGELYAVQLNSDTSYIAQASGYGYALGGFATNIDPIISISSNNLDPSLYNLSLSDGITQAFSTPTLAAPTLPSSVPEPETWALMVAGLGMVGIRVRRHATAVVSCAV